MATNFAKPNLFVGIDVSLNDFAASIYRGPNTAQRPTRLFANTFEGFETFLRWLSDHQLEEDQVLICVESTGVYAEALSYFLFENGLDVVVESALKIKQAFRQTNKDDLTDSQQIAEYGFRFFDRLELWQPKAMVIEQIRTLLMLREQLISQRSACRNMRHVLAKKVVQTKKALDVIDTQMTLLQHQITEIEREIKRLIARDARLKKGHTLLSSIPSVGLLLSAHLMVLSNGFERPLSARQLSAYLGICPYTHRSGKTVMRPSKSRRYGPRMVRKLLYLAAMNLKQHSPSHGRYYARKVAEGKSARLVLNNLSNKLLRIICAVLRDGHPYQKKHVSFLISA